MYMRNADRTDIYVIIGGLWWGTPVWWGVQIDSGVFPVSEIIFSLPHPWLLSANRSNLRS